jgi:CheY-like chemotaxis protein/two-component sensor histidine kinase
MTHLVDDLMEVSRITQGRMELRRQSVELAPLLEMALHSVASLADQAGHTLQVDQPDEPIWLDADATRLSQMIANLLTNAVKYTPAQGHIWLSVARADGEVVIAVRDSGIGIAPEHLQTVFDMFSQLEPALSRAQGGLGIGLSLVRGLAQLHGGSVSARSAGVGQGSTFELRLPLPAAPPVAAAAPASRQLQAGTRVGKVLVIDDNADAADTLAMALDILGYEVGTVYDGPSGLTFAEAFGPDVVLLDIGLPHMNGYEVARHLRGQPCGRDAILVAVTGWGQDKDRQLALDAGFDLHLTKPVDFVELDAVLQKMLAARPA